MPLRCRDAIDLHCAKLARSLTCRAHFQSNMESQPDVPADIQRLDDELVAVEREARELVADLGEALGTWRREPGSWSVAECLDHLTIANRVYLEAMAGPAARAREDGRWRKGAARPGFLGRLFARSLEPPVRRWLRIRAPRRIRPRGTPSLAGAFDAFVATQAEARALLRASSDLDLAGVRFPNPFVRGIRFSLATGFHVIAAHERRHIWQAWRVRRAAERAGVD
jgi:hypothetical protein